MTHANSNTDKQSLAIPDTVSYMTEERIEFLASLIVDRIAEDKASGQELLRQIEGNYESEQLTLT